MNSYQEPFPARYWDKADAGHIVCRLCPRACRLAEGQRGFCFIRQNIGQSLVLTAYGQTSGLCVDPIEKKPLNHFLPGSSVLSFGTIGCNLGCRFCQNWDLSRSREEDRLAVHAPPEAIARRARDLGCRSVALTYNEPVIFAEYAIDTADACHDEGVKSVAVTAGYITGEARRDFFQAMDAANVDLKSFSEEFYREYCQGSLRTVLETLLYLKNETSVWVEITTLLIPGRNDSQEEVSKMAEWIVSNLGPDVPLHLTAFHPAYRLMDTPATPADILQRSRRIARSQGVRHVYTGNIIDSEGSRTYCHACGKGLIERAGYKIGACHLIQGNRCAFCGAECAGVFPVETGAGSGGVS
ncbi:MAG TPA: AmmeMemoRadiSam system radical SAM enzyme [Candidatus Omnitrophota bacterium]|nr:AmmeMemoRadiSam system radical SAM enzyme [Candidatus Omnitrophota bacterium]HQP11159.1 AmmeMemoRadiSam system radical SAM enzyme [Candidatus Omnitrophota bacterium]